jgi:predicted component of type VI protein secretion system
MPFYGATLLADTHSRDVNAVLERFGRSARVMVYETMAVVRLRLSASWHRALDTRGYDQELVHAPLRHEPAASGGNGLG